MTLNKRITAMLLAVCMLSISLCGCKSKKEKQEQTPIGTCAGIDVLYEELRYVTLSYKDIFADTYGADIWDNPETAEQYRAELEEQVWSVMLNNYVVLAACKYYMLEIPLEDKAIVSAVDEDIDAAIEEYGSKANFRAALEELYMTEHFLRFCLSVAMLENELYYVLRDDAGKIVSSEMEFVEWLRDEDETNYVYVQHVFIRNDPGDNVEDNRILAQRVQLELATGSVVDTYIGNGTNEDAANLAPYFLVRDVYIEEIQDAVFALEEAGDVSEVIEISDGFYIFVRMEENEKALERQVGDLLYSYQWAMVEKYVEEFREGLTIELNDYGKSIDLLEIK